MKKLKLAEIERIRRENEPIVPNQMISYSRFYLYALADLALKQHEALKWYSDRNNYVVQINYDQNMKPIKSYNPISEMGALARQTLELVEDDDEKP